MRCFSYSINDILRDTDSELEEDESAAASRGKKKEKKGRKTGAAWLREGKEEDIVDFLDPSVSKKVLGGKFGTYFRIGRHVENLYCCVMILA